MNYGLHTIDHNFINFRPFGTFNSDLERESYEEFHPTNNGNKILTLFLHLFTGPVIYMLATNNINPATFYLLLVGKD
jgi:hypothetical protein